MGSMALPNRAGVAASMPVLNKAAESSVGAASTSSVVNTSSLLAGSSLGLLISKVATSVQDQKEELKRKQAEARDTEELLLKSEGELHQLISVVSQLHDLQQRSGDVLPEVLRMGPERPRWRPKPPFYWHPAQDYAAEFSVSGECGEIVTKTKDFEDQGWVIPVGGAWRLVKGGVYRWTLRIERKCAARPQLQLGIHGANHAQPWRLVTTSRCSWSRDDEPWQDRVGGDRLIDEGDYVHIEVDMRGTESKLGTLSLAINGEPFEQFFDDIPLASPYPLMPVVSMGGQESRVTLCPNY